MFAYFPLSLLALQPVLETAADGGSAEAYGEDNDIVVVAALPDTPSDEAFGRTALETDAIVALPRQNFEALLPLIPGAQQFRRSDSRSSNPSAQGVTLRALGGNAAARTLVLRDGVPIADPFFGSIAFTSLPVDTIERIVVSPGAGVGPFGSGGIAGVIEIESANALRSRRPLAEFGLGSFNTVGGALALGTRLQGGGVRFRIGTEQSDGFWTAPAGKRSIASVPAAYHLWNADLAASATLGSGRLDLRLGLFDDRRTLRFAGADSHSEGADVSVRWLRAGSGGWDVDAVGWLQLRDFSAVTISATSFRPVLDQQATPSLGWGGKIEVRPPAAMGSSWRFGVDVRGADGETQEVALAASGAVTLRRQAGGRSLLAGVFSEHEARVGQLVLAAGARVDHWRLNDGALSEQGATGAVLIDQRFSDRRQTRWSARGAGALALTPDLSLRLAAYRGFRVPTLNELYRPFVVFPVTTRANANLAPERLVGIEGGIAWGSAGQPALALTAFANRVEGAIANVTIGPNVRQRTNVPAIRTLGVEMVAQHGLGRIANLRLSAAWTNARVVGGMIAPALDGLRPAQTPRLSGSALLSVAGPGDARHSMLIRHGGAQFEDDRNIDVLPAFTTIDLSTRWPITPGLIVSLLAENIAGARIVTRNSGGSIDLGAPRSFRLTLRWGG